MPGRRRCVLARAVAALLAAGIVVAGCAAPVGSAPVAAFGAATASPGPAESALSSSPSSSPADRPFRPTPGPSPTFASYVVQPGDSLIALAGRFGTTPTSLAYWNRARYPTLDPDAAGYAPNHIEAGWTLTYLPGEVIDPENLPPAAASSKPRGSLEPFPVLPADGSAILVANGPRGSDSVALTFDYAGGPGAGAPVAAGADAFLQWLVARGVVATVFVAPAAADPSDPDGNAVLARLAAAPPAVTPGLLPARPGPRTPWDAALRTADARITGSLGHTTAPWLRVTGPLDVAALDVIGHAGWTWVVGADVEAGDGIPPAAGGPNAADIAARVISRATGGSIIRLTLGGAHTLEALPAILDGLAAAGLRVVSLTDLLGVAGR